MNNSVLVDIKNKKKIERYKFVYNCSEMYYFLKEFSIQDFKQIEFKEHVKEDKAYGKPDIKSIKTVDEVIEYRASCYPDKDGMYEVKGIGVNFSPFIKIIKSDNILRDEACIKPVYNTLYMLSDFLENNQEIEKKRKIQLVKYYFGLFDIKKIGSNTIEDLKSFTDRTFEFDEWVQNAKKNEEAVQNIESYNIKLLKR